MEDLRLINKADFIRSVFKDRTDKIVKDELLVKIQENWDTIAGALAAHSWPVKFSGKILHIRVEKSVYAQELSLYQSWILKILNELSIPAESIKIENGSLKSIRRQSFAKEISQNTDNQTRKLTDAQKELLKGLGIKG